MWKKKNLPASKKTFLKSRGHSLRNPSSEPVTQNDSLTHIALMAMPAP